MFETLYDFLSGCLFLKKVQLKILTLENVIIPMPLHVFLPDLNSGKMILRFDFRFRVSFWIYSHLWACEHTNNQNPLNIGHKYLVISIKFYKKSRICSFVLLSHIYSDHFPLTGGIATNLSRTRNFELIT